MQAPVRECEFFESPLLPCSPKCSQALPYPVLLLTGPTNTHKTRKVRSYFPSSQTDPVCSPRSTCCAQGNVWPSPVPPARQVPHRHPRRAPPPATRHPRTHTQRTRAGISVARNILSSLRMYTHTRPPAARSPVRARVRLPRATIRCRLLFGLLGLSRPILVAVRANSVQ